MMSLEARLAAAKDLGAESTEFYKALGYKYPVEFRGQVCGLMRFIFTWSIVVGIDAVGYSHRYCYDTEASALRAFIEWVLSGSDEPAGYIVRKGLGPDHRPEPRSPK